MPVSTHTHYQDPETGKTLLMPQLFPHATSSETTSSKEIEEWVKEGIIPKSVYEEDVASQKKMADITKRLSEGEKIDPSELPSKPWELTQFLIKNKASLYGENVLKKIFSKLVESDPDAVWLSFIKEAITSIASLDPLPIHFATARRTLKKHGLEDTQAADILAREIVTHCSRIQKFKSLNHPIFEKITITPKDLEIRFKSESEEILEIDQELIEYLKQFGKPGKDASKKVQENSKELYSHYKQSGYSSEFRPSLWSLWTVDYNDEETISPFLSLIARVAWEYSCSASWNRQSKQYPAITKPVIETLKHTLNPKEKKKFVTNEDDLVCLNEQGQPLFIAPAIDANLIDLHKKGVKWISTLTGHRLLRWQIKTGFEKWSVKDEDPRSIIIDGGYSHIAQLAGCPSTHEIAKVKAILHAQAYGEFIFPNGSRGNMINLNIQDKYKNGEPSKISIVLGDMLLPNYVFTLEKRERRLIPIGNLPPLHGSKNTHAKQAHLQLLVFEEFSNQSNRLAEDGCVIITLEKWEAMAFEAGLDPKKIQSIIEYWRQPDFVNCFLDKQGDEYRLATYYDDAQKFLVHQGKQRVSNSKKGMASAIAKKKAKSKSKKA